MTAREQSNTPQAAKPYDINTRASLSTVQPGNGGNIGSQAEPGKRLAQAMEALQPFSRALTSAFVTGSQLYATNQIDAGYADAQNEYAKAQLILQKQQEVAATNAGSQITQLEKVDPVAAILLKDANPWKQIGRRRAIAQIAGADLDDKLNGALTARFGELTAMAPGSGELMKVRSDETRRIMDRYGLSEDMPEVAQYFTPAMNRAWDKFATKHETAYNDQLTDSTIAAGTAAMSSRLTELTRDGVSFQGRVLMPGQEGWGILAGQVLTQELDTQLGMLGGSDRVRALKEVREQLTGAFGSVPFANEAISEILGGNPSMPPEKRPTWGASYGLDLMELKNRGSDAVLKEHENRQQAIENELDDLWYSEGMPGMLNPTDPQYGPSLISFRNQAFLKGYRDVDGYMGRRVEDTQGLMEKAYRPDPLAFEDFLTEVDELPSSAFASGQSIAELRKKAREIARLEPTPELQAQRYREINERIDQRREQAEKLPSGVESQINNSLLQDLALPSVKAITDKEKPGGQSTLGSLIGGGADPGTAVASAFGSSALVAYTNDLKNLYVRSVERRIQQWEESHPGQALTAATRNVLTSEAIAEARKSKDYERIYGTLTGQKPGEVGEPARGSQQGTAPSERARGVQREKASALPDTTVKGYAVRPVMTGEWLRSELKNVYENKPVSPELYDMAKRAGTTTDRYLLEQLRFYPQNDPKGDLTRFLRDRVTKARQNQTVSSANYVPATRGLGMVPAGYNPLRPGSWLMNMIMPPAAAGTLPPNFGGASSPFGDDARWSSGPAVAASHRETGAGYTIPNARDASGRPVILSRGGANSLAAMVRDSGGQVRYSDIASAQRSDAKNRSVGGVSGSQHLGGNALDIHGTSIAWIRKHGAKYGWHVNDYDGTHGGHVEFRGGGTAQPSAATRRGGGMTGLATYYTGSGGSDGVAGGPTANGERYNPNAMTAAVQWSLRGKYMNKWVTVENLDTGKTVKVWVNDVGQMGGSERSINRQDPRVIDLSPAAFKKLFGSTSRGVGRIRIIGS